MLILLYSDPHTRPERIMDCDYVFGKIKEIALEKKVNYVYNGGDTFHTRGLIKTSCFDLIYRHFSDWAKSGIRQIINIGNHDQEDKAGAIHPMRVFSQFDQWHVIDEPKKIWHFPNIAFFPYSPNVTEEMIQKTFEIEGEGPCDAFVHWPIYGSSMTPKMKEEGGVPREWLKRFRNVISGHFHYRDKIDNVYYIGSPFQQNFAEMGQEKGVTLYETDTGKMEFIEIEGTPKHHVVQIYWEDGKKKTEKGDIKSNDFVKVHVKGDSGQVSRVDRSKLEKSLGNDSITIQREIESETYSRMNLGEKEIYDTTALMEKYVDFVEVKSLNKDKLKEIGKEIINGNPS